VPDAPAPRVYREYPLRGSSFLPINFILNGKFAADQERARLLMNEEDKALIDEGFAAALVGVRYAFASAWQAAHLLARACPAKQGFDPTDAGERAWWSERLASFARELSLLPIVECTSQSLPASDPEGPYADFVIPRLLPTSANDESTVDRMWPLAELRRLAG